MPGMDGMDAAKAILHMNPAQRIIFASAYVLSTLQESIKHLNAVVELLQKPFELDVLIDTVEDKAVFEELKKINVNVNTLQSLGASHAELQELLMALKKLRQSKPLVQTHKQ